MNKTRSLLLKFAVIAVLVGTFLLEAYTLFVQSEGDSPLPENFGNFERNRAALEKQPNKEEFAFAVVGDTKSLGTFERIAKELRKMPLDFAVLLGDVAYEGTENAHRYLRAELAEYAQPYPVFYVVGNHDVSPAGFTIRRFEETYGPSIFSFEYQGSLFIVLQILNEPFSNEESIAFLTRLRDGQRAKHQRIFVFMHIPPPISSDFVARRFQGHAKLVDLLNQIGVDYVFAGDYHGYARVKLRDTIYIVSGGGGARLEAKLGKQFHHALVVRVGKGFVSERFVHVNRDHDFEDFFEKAAIMHIWPWLVENSFFAYCANGVFLLVLLLSFKSLIATRRSTGLSQ
jgi:predicted phosphodiesterase